MPRHAILRVILSAVVLGAVSCTGGSGGGQVTGRFVSWDPVDDVRGYATVELTNNGTSEANAKCFVEVTDNFGDSGFDELVGEPVGPGETKTVRVALTVQNHAALLINHGEVKDC